MCFQQKTKSTNNTLNGEVNDNETYTENGLLYDPSQEPIFPPELKVGSILIQAIFGNDTATNFINV